MAVAVSARPHPGTDRSAVHAELGAVRWGPVAGAGAGAVALALLDLTVWSGGPGSLLTWLSAALTGAAAALALDRPAAAVTDAAPYPSGRRLAARLLVAAGGGACWAAYAALVVGGRPPGVPVSWGAVTTAGLGLLLLAPAVAVLLAGPDNPEPGSLAGSLGVLVVVGLMTVPLPRDLDPFDVSGMGSDATLVWGAVVL
ncbi:MAG: hypothetical protein ABWX84_06495, partial [Nocardioides sp.]